jgi:hypothetical protein
MIKEISKQTKSMYIRTLWVVVREKVIACIHNKPVLKILIIGIIIINILHGGDIHWAVRAVPIMLIIPSKKFEYLIERFMGLRVAVVSKQM